MYVGQWPTLHGPVILSYLKDYLMDKCHIWDIGSIDAKIYFIKWAISWDYGTFSFSVNSFFKRAYAVIQWG